MGANQVTPRGGIDNMETPRDEESIPVANIDFAEI